MSCWYLVNRLVHPYISRLISSPRLQPNLLSSYWVPWTPCFLQIQVRLCIYIYYTIHTRKLTRKFANTRFLLTTRTWEFKGTSQMPRFPSEIKTVLYYGSTTGWMIGYLAGVFIFFSNFTPIPGEMIQFDEHIFQMGWFNHQPDMMQ